MEKGTFYEALYESHHEVVIRLIEKTFQEAHKFNVEVGICGELGSDTELAKRFYQMGIDELSMAPSKIPKVAYELGKIEKKSDAISMAAKTKHAFSIKSQDTEVLVHVGIDTVEMNGRGFESNLYEGREVKAGEELMRFDIEAIKGAGYEPIVVVVKLS